MRSSSKHGGTDNNSGISGPALTLHQRLYHALNLGTWENKEKWCSSDIEIQRLVLRSIDAFLDCISSETLQYPLVKDSSVDAVRALKSILELKSQSILSFASNVTVKMVNVLPSSRLQIHILDLICPLANLLSSQQLQVAVSCATALNSILSKLSSRHECKVWQILKETEAVAYIVDNIKQFCVHEKPIEYFQEMSSVLSKILLRWPSFRFSVWNDSTFLNSLDAVELVPENSVKISVLQLYSSLALCGSGADKLLENGETLLQLMVGCMDSRNTWSVRTEAFKLARCLALSRSRCTKMMNICCEPLVRAVTSAMKNWSSLSDKFDKCQLSVMEEACRFLTTITGWAGDHHIYFWRAGVDRILLGLVLESHSKIHQLQRDLRVNDLINIVRESYNANPVLSFRPYVWDILGGLAANCADNINHEMHGNELQLSVLIICACLSFIDSVGALRQVSQKSITTMSDCESSSRAVLMMIYSPCKYIASSARSILCEILKSDDKDYVEYLLEILKVGLTGNKFGLPGNLELLVSLMSLACYCTQPTYRKHIIKLRGVKTVVAFITRWLNSPVRTKRDRMVPRLRCLFIEKTCCFPGKQDWEGEDTILLFSLWILAELLHNYNTDSMNVHPHDLSEAELIHELQKICRDDHSHGSRSYAAYILSHYGLFGFPSKLGKRIRKSLGEMEYSDLKLDLVNDEPVFVHGVILTVRCPSLIPSTVKFDTGNNSVKSVRLSAHVDRQSLLKLLEYVYSGYIQASADLVKNLKILARHCKMESLLQMLSRRNPKWGVLIPNFDLRPALGPSGHYFSDLILEAGSGTQLVPWKCSGCCALVPHLHVHKVILESSCEYLRALFRSGMQESHVQTIKVPVCWQSLNKLVDWFYSDQLDVPSFDCIWDNLDLDHKFQEVQTYLELCWLTEFWLIEDLHEECYKVVVSCLDSSKCLSVKIIQAAANLSQWQLAQVAADYMAPSYHHLRNLGELDSLDDNLVEMVRASSVRLAQDDSHHSS